jgi:hypothetical protein
MKSLQPLLALIVVVACISWETVSAFSPSNFATSHGHRQRLSHLSAPNRGRGIAPNGVSASVNLRASDDNYNEYDTDRDMNTPDMAAQFMKEFFFPAVVPVRKFALLETAVHAFVIKVGLWNNPSLLDPKSIEQLMNIQNEASSLASFVLTCLVSSSGDGSKSNFNWSGPTKMAQIDNDGLFVVGLKVLGALVAFIENEHTSQDNLMAFSLESRKVAGDGKLLDALYGGAPVEMTEAMAKSMEMRAGFDGFDGKSKGTIRPKTENQGAQLAEELDKVEKALTDKGLAPNALGKKAALEVLERICSFDKSW